MLHLMPQHLASKTHKPTSMCENLPPLLCASLPNESSREVNCSESHALQDEVKDISTSQWESSNREEGHLFLSSASTIDDMSSKTLDIQQPVFAKPTGKRPWARIILNDIREADAMDSRATDSNVRQLIDIESPGADELSHTWSENAECSSLSFDSAILDVSHKTFDVRPPLRAKLHSQRPVPRARLRCKQTADAVDCPARDSKVAQVNDIESPRADAQKASETRSVPSRQSLIGKHQLQTLNPIAVQAKQSDSSKSASNARGQGQNAKMVGPQAPPPRASKVVIENKNDKDSGMKYNLVQFMATPTLSTASDSRKQNLTRRATRAKTVETPRVRIHEKALDSETSTEILFSMFDGWSRREVKEMLRDQYSSEEIAEVLQVLQERDQRQPRRSRSRKTSYASRV